MTSKVELKKIRDSYLFTTSDGGFVANNEYHNFLLYTMIDTAIDVLPEKELEKMTSDEVIFYAAAAIFGEKI